MADLALELESTDYLAPLEADVRILTIRQRDSELPVLELDSRHDDVDQNLLSTTVSDPICLRGVGGTTL